MRPSLYLVSYKNCIYQTWFLWHSSKGLWLVKICKGKTSVFLKYLFWKIIRFLSFLWILYLMAKHCRFFVYLTIGYNLVQELRTKFRLASQAKIWIDFYASRMYFSKPDSLTLSDLHNTGCDMFWYFAIWFKGSVIFCCHILILSVVKKPKPRPFDCTIRATRSDWCMACFYLNWELWLQSIQFDSIPFVFDSNISFEDIKFNNTR